MQEDTIKLLKSINDNLGLVVLGQNDIKDQLSTILMAIYDVDFTPNEVDTSDLLKGLGVIAKELKNISDKQRTIKNPQINSDTIYR